MSPSAVKASAGAVEHLLLYPADDLPGTLTDLHGRGVRVVGADGDAPLTARETDLRGPLALVVGSEGKGLGAAVRRRADAFMRIPMKGAVGSLNAAVAGSILLFEALAQRDASPGARPTDTRPEPPDGEGPSTPADAPSEAPKPTRRRTTAKRAKTPAPPSADDTGENETPKPPRRRSTTKRAATVTPPPVTDAADGEDLLPADAAPKPKRRTKTTDPKAGGGA
jgi:tRNA(Leu) C34 or U34 (ribose-2'-O)-methylase TrmL